MVVDIVILAAGKGTRMKSSLPKVLHTLAGKPLIQHVIDTANQFEDAKLTVVVGHGGEAVQSAIADKSIQWVEQKEQRGTAHAVLQALPVLRKEATTLVLYGDVPLISYDTLKNLVDEVNHHTLALLTVTLDDPTGYGRILRDDDGHISGIVEQKDASPLQRDITEVNTGVMAIPPEGLHAWLHHIDDKNAQGEFYLTDLIAIAREHGISIHATQPGNIRETDGINSRQQMESLERYYQRNIAEELMAAGVSLMDAGRFDCRGTLKAGPDSCIDINCVFEGEVLLGSNVSIGPNCYLKDVTVGDGVTIKPNTVIEGPVTIGKNVDIGPFARLRPGTQLSDYSRIGNFVETKKAIVGKGSKVNHLSYVGDATLGDGVNVGAGTITCNYDGVNKFQTIMKDGAFIGSNTSLVAPVTVGENATVGAGSTITRDVEDGTLAVARGKQKTVEGWKRPEKQHKD